MSTVGKLVSRIRGWIQDDLLKRLAKNSGYLLGGSVAGSVLGLGSLALTTRALGVEAFGTLILIQVYVTVVDRLVNFQAWQALIKYGADVLEDEQDEKFKTLIKFGTCLDFGTATLGTLVALGGVPLVASWQGWSVQAVDLAYVYSFTILFNLAGTPTAILRLFDEFRLFAVQRVVASATKLAAVAVAFWVGADLWTFGLIWMGGEVIGYVLLVLFGHRELWKQGYTRFWRAPFRDVLSENEGLWSYVWTTNLHGTVRMASLRLDTLVVGGYLGESAAGLYKVAKELGRVLSRLSQPLYKAIYPDLARLWSRNEHRSFARLVFRSGAFAGAGGILVWFGIVAFGDRILALAAGPEYVKAYAVMVWYMLGVVVSVAAFPVTPAVLAMGLPKVPFYTILATTVFYFASLVPLLETFGLIWAGMSFFGFYVVWCVFMAGIMMYKVRNATLFKPVLSDD